MAVNFSKQITGRRLETYTASLFITAIQEVNFDREGQDVRDANPDEAQRLVEIARAKLEDSIVRRAAQFVIERLSAQAIDGVIATDLVKNKLTLVNPKYKEVKKDGVSVSSTVKVSSATLVSGTDKGIGKPSPLGK